ncbi:nardilysin [Drosophila innubila]|uniref:nardilysin n=1 Tax=Drosophila innubila TaxID=198719 RepID=UPI00148C2176|nr:nardilysin [Drosophila innubila]XP_034475046.1 nardilysin [Drosophila innubila]XP_034475054.1 nardilysin [Drosophila innubila]
MLWPQRSSRCFTLCLLTSTLSSSSFVKFATNFQCHLPQFPLVRQFVRFTRYTKHKQQPKQKLFDTRATTTRTLAKMSDQVKYLDTPDKSETDKKLYKTLLLPNGLHALIISDPSPVPHDGFTTSDSSDGMGETETENTSVDPESSSSSSESESSSSGTGHSESDSDSEVGDEKLAACAIMIDYGSFAEPRNYQGLAHFLEHMIFMGSEKYPEENIFDAHIKKCGGFTNALTDCEDTLFYFEVAEKHLDSSLDYFTALMKHPLMKQEAMQRERCSVDSEFQQIVQEDETRRDQLLASLATDGYPHGTFAWGNLKTLKQNVDDEVLHKLLHEIRRDHYAANRMYLCLQARLPIEELESLVLRHFADIPSNQVTAPDLSKFNYRSAFRAEFHEHAFFVKPVENVCKVELTWVLPSVRKYYRSKPDQFLAFLLGYEGKGSLCAYLRRRLWALELVAGIDDNGFDLNSMYSLFNVCIYLTDEGFKHIDDVLAATFAYVKVIAQANPKDLRVIYEEQQGIEATGFRFQPQRPAMDNVQDLVINSKYFPPKDVLTGKELYYEYNEQHLAELIAHLNEFKFNLMFTARSYEDVVYDKREDWFGTEYASIPMPSKWQQLWQEADSKPLPDLFLPEPNRFVAHDFTIFWHQQGKPEIPEAPKKLLQNDICELWFRADDKYELPEAFMTFYFISPLQRKSPKNDAMCALYEELVKFHVSEDLYPATSAGFNYTFSVSEKGLNLQVRGYNEKLHLLVEGIAQAMVTVESTLNEDILETFVKDQRKSYFNTLIKPRQLNRDVRLCVVEHMRWLMIDKYKSLNDITLKDLRDFARQFPQQLYVQGLVQGNYTEESAHNVMNTLLSKLGCKPIQERLYVEDRTVQLPQGAHYIRCHALNEQDTNTVITNYYQIGANSVRLECMLDLLMMFVEEPLFDQLRTKEQLGYHVGATVRMNYGIAGYSIVVNSQETNTTASHVDKRIEHFRNNMMQMIEDMAEEEYEHIRDSLIKLKLVADMALSTEVTRNWSEIINEEYMFDRRRQQIEVLRTLEKAEIVAFLLQNELDNLRKVSVQVIGHQPKSKTLPSEEQSKIAENKQENEQEDVDNDEDDDEDEDGDVEMDEVDEELFEMLANKLSVKFLPPDGDASTILDIAEFKSNLNLYPKPAITLDETKRPTLIEDALMNT